MSERDPASNRDNPGGGGGGGGPLAGGSGPGIKDAIDDVLSEVKDIFIKDNDPKDKPEPKDSPSPKPQQ